MIFIGSFNQFSIYRINRNHPMFYCVMGRFFCNRQVIKELQGPIYDDIGYEWFISVDKDDVIAFSSIRRLSADAFQFGETWVDPQYRRQGIFTKLFDTKENHCWNQNANVIKGMALDISSPVFLSRGWTPIKKRGNQWTIFEKRQKGIYELDNKRTD